MRLSSSCTSILNASYFQLLSSLILLVLSIYQPVKGLAEDKPKSFLNGTVRDQTTQQAIATATITVIGQPNKNATSNEKGSFSLQMPIGTYSIQVSHPSYKTIVKTDIVATAVRVRPLTIELRPLIFQLESVNATTNFFLHRPDISTSAHNFNFAEVRRSAGGFEDIHRAMRSVPGVTSASDNLNALVVRGGHPRENLTLLDGIEIPNSNHYGEPGSASGGISMINLDFVRESNFYTGGFSSKYGDKLSSVMDIKLREGNRDRIQADINAGFAGFGAMLEGPFPNRQGSWMASWRRSYFDLLMDLVPDSFGGTTAIPNYSNFQTKVTYDLTPTNLLSMISLGGIDQIRIMSSDDPLSRGTSSAYRDSYQYTLGFNWRWLFAEKGYSNLTLAHSCYQYMIDVGDSKGAKAFTSDTLEGETQLKGEINYDLAPQHQVILGTSTKLVNLNHKFNSRGIDVYNNETGRVVQIGNLDIDQKERTYKANGYLHYTLRPIQTLDIKLGARTDYYNLTKQRHLSPRLGWSYQLTTTTQLNIAYGTYYQTPAYFFMMWDKQNRNLQDLKATHYILGIEHFYAKDLRFSIETYRKNYDDYPISNLEGATTFSNNGSGLVQGIDLLLQKKLSKKLYGRVSYTYSVARFESPELGEFDWDFDIRHVASINGGYKISEHLEFSLQWRYISGKPYTPITGSFELVPNSGDWEPIYADAANSGRLDDYHALDFRIDRRFHFTHWNLVTYLDISNLYNRKNIWSIEWVKQKNQTRKTYGLGITPIAGFHIEF
ncbi:hypothetical protein CMK22_20100 [Candidatus Poribacteria bacterium]|nr:hypothetical protein [Candidatus Poribacteria bacterium]